jgi:hypothetical protein
MLSKPEEITITITIKITITITIMNKPFRWTPVSLPASDRARDSAVHLEKHVYIFQQLPPEILTQHSRNQVRIVIVILIVILFLQPNAKQTRGDYDYDYDYEQTLQVDAGVPTGVRPR